MNAPAEPADHTINVKFPGTVYQRIVGLSRIEVPTLNGFVVDAVVRELDRRDRLRT